MLRKSVKFRLSRLFPLDDVSLRYRARQRSLHSQLQHEGARVLDNALGRRVFLSGGDTPMARSSTQRVAMIPSVSWSLGEDRFCGFELHGAAASYMVVESTRLQPDAIIHFRLFPIMFLKSGPAPGHTSTGGDDLR